MAASLVNRDLPYTFSTSAVGFTLNPEELGGDAIRCSYPRETPSLDGRCLPVLTPSPDACLPPSPDACLLTPSPMLAQIR